MDPQKFSTATRIAIGLAIGCLSGVLGLAPWLITGATLPLQNLWESDVLSADMPVSLLPVSQYFAIRILALLVVGGAIAGLAIRLLRPRLGVRAWTAAAGVALVHCVALLQSFAVVADGLGMTNGSADARALLYFGGMLGGTLAASLMAKSVVAAVNRTGSLMSPRKGSTAWRTASVG